MSNVSDYLKWRGDLDFSQAPFNDVDNLILAQIAYVDFTDIVPAPGSIETITIAEAADTFFDTHDEKEIKKCKSFIGKAPYLLREAAATKRFGSLILTNYVDYVDGGKEEQFAAFHVRIDNRLTYIAFRGTDDTLVGWKEDFNMSFLSPVPSQKDAVRYIDTTVQRSEGKLILGGHSKGGNLATYASSQVEPSLQDRIKQIYSFDAPGLNHTIIETEGYQSIASKIKRYIPQGSIVGMMLETPKQAHIVKSVAIGGIAQHDTFSWQIENEHFVLLDTLNPDSIQTDKTLKEWVETVPDDELKDFFDVFFGLILDAQITSIDEFFQPNSIKKLLTIVQNAHALTGQEKEMLSRLTRLLISIRYQAWIDDFKTPSPMAFMTDVRESWTSLAERFSFSNKDE